MYSGWWGFILAVPGFNAMFESSPNAGLSIVQLGVGTAMTNLGVIVSRLESDLFRQVS
jgi:hypothetical protein